LSLKKTLLNKSKKIVCQTEAKISFFTLQSSEEEEEGCASLFLVLRESFDTRFIYIQKNISLSLSLTTTECFNNNNNNNNRRALYFIIYQRQQQQEF